MHENEPKTINLYRKRDDGSIGLRTLSRTMFSDQDSFMEALDHCYSEGYFDTAAEAREANNLTSGFSM